MDAGAKGRRGLLDCWRKAIRTGVWGGLQNRSAAVRSLVRSIRTVFRHTRRAKAARIVAYLTLASGNMDLAPQVEALIPTLAALPTAVMTTDCEGVICWANACLSALTGYAVDEIVGRNAGVLLSGDPAHSYHDVLEHVVASGEPWKGDWAGRRKDGGLYNIEQTIAPIEDSAGKTTHLLWTTLDAQNSRAAGERWYQQAERRYRDIFEGAAEGMYRTTLEGKSLSANPALATILGYDSAQDLVSAITDTTHQLWLDPNERLRLFELLEQQDVVRGYESQFKRKDGTRIWVSLNIRKVRGEGDDTAYYEGFIEDITERKDAEKQLQAEHERFQRIMDSTDAGYFRIGMDGRYEDVNPAWLRMYGFTRKEDVVGRHFSAVQVPEDVAGANKIVESLLRGESVRSGEFSRLRRDGTIGYHSFSANPVLDGDRVIGIEGFLIDISDRKRAERDRLHTEQRYRSLFNCMHEGVALHRLIHSNGIPENYVLLDVNRRFEEILGVNREQAVNKPATEVYGSTDAPYLKEYAAVVDTGTPFQFQTYFPPMDKHFSISVAPMGDDVFATIFFEITKQKKTEEALQQANDAIAKAERHYRRIFNSVSDAVFVHSLGDDGLPGRFIEVNDIACRRLGYTRDELLQLRPTEIDAPDTVAGVPAIMKRLQAEGYAVWEGAHLSKDGRRIPVEISNRIFEFEGAPTIIASVRDVTERKQAEAAQAKLEEQLRQAQKLESIGRLAGGVAHDFNNLLTVINGYADFLLADLDPNDPLWSSADEIRKAGERAASLTKQLLAFSRKQIIEPKALDLNTTIRDSERMLQRLIGEDVMLTTTLDPSLGQVMADPEQVHQVIMNLVVNARDAMPDGGRLEISTANIDVTERDASMQQDARPGPHVMVTVTDTGTGMDERTRQHIFEPFFTTKKGDKGTGLGLSTVYGIMRQSGGWIYVSSHPGRGTSFKLYFPRIDGCGVVERGETARSRGTLGGETILVVEDQEAVRRLTVAMLKVCGYDILEAANAHDALEIAQRHSGEIHLLLTDVVLPGINGKELSERLKTVRPKLKVLFTSGYTAEIIGHRGVLGHGLAYIPKPFGPGTLAAKVREVLSEPSTA